VLLRAGFVTTPPEEDSNAGIPSVLCFGTGQRGFLFFPYLTNMAFKPCFKNSACIRREKKLNFSAEVK
jgi:hypothetical protein